MRRSAMHVVAVRIVREYEDRNIRHRAHIDKLLDHIADVSFVKEKIANALNDIARCVDDNSRGKHFQWFAISLGTIGFRCPRPME